MTRELWAMLLTLWLLQACALPQPPDAVQLAIATGARREVASGAGYRHVLYEKSDPRGRTRLHVYLGGDGTPWIAGDRIAKDPTPRNPLTLRLFARDPGASLFVGRPCYQGLAGAPGCTPLLWTQGRYSEAVVASMQAVIEGYMRQHGYRDLVLIGYSGGGALAQLLASRMPQTVALVTVAANLDPQAWAAYHGYTPLDRSLNPRTDGRVPAGIFQLHLVGGRDRNIPPELLREMLPAAQRGRLLVYPRFDHVCCWEDIWAEVLAQLPRSPRN